MLQSLTTTVLPQLFRAAPIVSNIPFRGAQRSERELGTNIVHAQRGQGPAGEVHLHPAPQGMPEIEVLDLCFQGRPECVAAFLLHHPAGPILVECGPATVREQLLRELAQRSLNPSDIRALLVTHIHLDHAGDAGWWTSQGVPLVVHPAGAPHLIDPSKLLASASRIYGESMQRLWGEILPCPESLVQVATPDAALAGELSDIVAWDTPGHARHHLAYAWRDQVLTGDVAGVSLPNHEGGPLSVSVPAPPPEFELEVWLASLDKLEKLQAKALYLTHFGAVSEVQAHLQLLREQLQAVTQFVGERREQEREALVTAYTEWQRPHFGSEATFDRYQQANPLFMSVDGLLRYWKKRA
jgi:glyoxylase-like metal-dependent hydrolase (beta-lactamase superfamily II)